MSPSVAKVQEGMLGMLLQETEVYCVQGLTDEAPTQCLCSISLCQLGMGIWQVELV